MESPGKMVPQFIENSKRIASQLVAIAENRFSLLTVELLETRENIVRLVFLALAMATCGLLAGMGLSGVIVLCFWDSSPLLALGVLTVLYGVATIILYRRILRIVRKWEMLPATRDQLRKDSECVKGHLT